MTATSSVPTATLDGGNIAEVLRSEGPVVSCVVLRATSSDDDPKKSEDLVEEIQLDTTPKKNEVEKCLGGPFTFVGQYEDEGIMLMARRGCVVDDEDDEDVPKNVPATISPHKLQPPFNNQKVYGDILVLKVAPVADPLDDKDATTSTKVEAPSNDDFFLNYSKEDYLKFAARTDVVAPELPVHEEENVEEEEDDDEEEDEENWSDGDDEEEDELTEEEAQAGLMQLLMTSVIRKFQEENGRGPSSEELMVLKMTVGAKLGIPIGGDEDECAEANDSEKDKEATAADETKESGESLESKKRSCDSNEVETVTKKVKFATEEGKEQSTP